MEELHIKSCFTVKRDNKGILSSSSVPWTVCFSITQHARLPVLDCPGTLIF